MQLALFPQEFRNPYEEIEDMKERYEKLRKSQHARITSLQKEIKDLKSDLELIKSHICKGTVFLC